MRVSLGMGAQSSFMETLVSASRELRGVVPGIVIEGGVTPTLIHMLCSDLNGRRKAHSFEGPIAFEECHRHEGHENPTYLKNVSWRESRRECGMRHIFNPVFFLYPPNVLMPVQTRERKMLCINWLWLHLRPNSTSFKCVMHGILEILYRVPGGMATLFNIPPLC